MLEEKTFRRVGGSTDQRVNVRVIAATNRDLDAEVRAGRFRQDLFYRLNVIGIVLPPLRERSEDIPGLVNYYVESYNAEFRKRITGVSPEAMTLLTQYGWPGNIRELRNAVERAMLLAAGTELVPEDFPAAAPTLARLNEDIPLPSGGVNLEHLERSLVIQALQRSDWNQTQAARLLGLNRDQIRYRIEKFGLEKTAAREQTIRRTWPDRQMSCWRPACGISAPGQNIPQAFLATVRRVVPDHTVRMATAQGSGAETCGHAKCIDRQHVSFQKVTRRHRLDARGGTTTIVVGCPAAEIVRFAREHDADRRSGHSDLVREEAMTGEKTLKSARKFAPRVTLSSEQSKRSSPRCPACG